MARTCSVCASIPMCSLRHWRQHSGTCFFALPLAFSKELDACGVNQQVQAGCARAVRHLHIQTALAATQCTEVGNWPQQYRQR